MTTKLLSINFVYKKNGIHQMIQNQKYKLIIFGLIITIIWVFFFRNNSPSHSSKSDFLEEIRKSSELSDDVDVWSGRVRAYQGPKNPDIRGIVIEGLIEEGDFKRFVQIAKKIGPKYSTVFLFSPGGNAIEAMKIGSAIRQLRYNTEVVPFDVHGERKCFFEDVKPQNCTCESACFLVFVGGVDRYSNLLGIHRIYLDHDALKSVQGSDAINVSKIIKSQVSQYLFDMGTPARIIEKMFSVPSNEMAYLSPSELNQFKGEIEDVEEWISAKCPPVSAEEARHSLYESGFNMKGFEAAEDKIIMDLNRARCRNNVMENFAREGWASVFGSM